jgi:Bacterial protein of unknown function (DUF885)
VKIPRFPQIVRSGKRAAEPVRRFRSVAQRFLEESWRRFPQRASEAGLHDFDGELGANDRGTHLAQRRLLAETLRDVEALPDSAFVGDDWLDRRGFLALLRTELFANATREDWRIDPQRHVDVAADSVLMLAVKNTERLSKVRPAIESRLAEVPRFLEEGAAGLRNPVPLWCKLAVESCRGAVEFLDQLGPELARLSPTPAKTEGLVSAAGGAFRRYAQAIERKTPGSADGYAIGRESFEMLIRERTGLPYSLPEVRALGGELVARFSAELEREARKFGRKKAAQILEEAATRWTPQAPSLRDEYARLTVEMRDRFQRADAVAFPENERCRVLLVPKFLQHHFPTAAYHPPGPFDPDQTGIHWVNDLSLIAATPAQRAAEIRQHFGCELTVAHEAYPGHHLQFVRQNRHPSKLRRLFGHAIYYEGWTLWVEKMSIELGLVDFPEARLTQLNDALWRAYRIGIDVDLHDRALTFAGACRRLQDGVGFTPARARADVNWYTASPTIPMSYLLGRLEVERLHARLVGTEGWTLRQFNDWILSQGSLPWSWIWQARLHGAFPASSAPPRNSNAG